MGPTEPPAGRVPGARYPRLNPEQESEHSHPSRAEAKLRVWS